MLSAEQLGRSCDAGSLQISAFFFEKLDLGVGARITEIHPKSSRGLRHLIEEDFSVPYATSDSVHHLDKSVAIIEGTR